MYYKITDTLNKVKVGISEFALLNIILIIKNKKSFISKWETDHLKRPVYKGLWENATFKKS